MFGLAFFQVLLVATALILKKLRTATRNRYPTSSMDRKEGAPAILSFHPNRPNPGRRAPHGHLARYDGNTDTVLSTAIARLIVIALAFACAPK